MKKSVILFAVIALLSSIISPAQAGQPDKVGWKVVFSLSCSSGAVEFGANDAASGYSRMPVMGQPVNMDLADGYSGVIHQGSNAPFTECLVIEPQSSAPSTYMLSWATFNWDPLWLYQPGELWSPWKVHGVIADQQLDLSKPGSITLSNFQPNYMLDGQPYFQLGITANAVPEPGSLLALMTGLTGLGGFVLRKHR